MSINSRHHSDEPRTVKAVILVGLLVGGLERNEPPPCQEGGFNAAPAGRSTLSRPPVRQKTTFRF